MPKPRRTRFDTDTAAAILNGWGCFPDRDTRLLAAFAVSEHPDRFSPAVQREACALLARSGRHGAREARRRIEHQLPREETLVAAR